MPQCGTKTRIYPRTQFQAVHNLNGFSVSPDGTELAYISDTSGSPNLWLASLGGRAEPPRQLTAFAHRAVRQVTWLADATGLVFTADRDGDENAQLFSLALERSLSGEIFPRWPSVLVSAPGRRTRLARDPVHAKGPIPFASNRRDPAVFDVCTVDPASLEIRTVWTPPTSETDLTQVTADGTCALVLCLVSNTVGLPYRVNLLTGEAESLMPRPPEGDEVMEIPVAQTEDGRTVYLLSNRGQEFLGLLKTDTSSQEWEWVLRPESDIEDVERFPDGKRLFVRTNEDGESRGYRFDLATSTLEPVSNIGASVVWESALSPDGTALFTLGESATSPRSIRRVLLSHPGTKPETLVSSWIAPIPDKDLTKPEVVRLASADGLSFSAWIYRPAVLSAASRVPVVLSIHGGPESQERPIYAYAGLYQYLTHRGIAVVAPNIRGSTGFGKSFQKRIHRDWGGMELEDLRAVARFMATQDWIDPARMAVFGGSFGGFATLSVISRLPDFHWAAAVSICGPSNLVSFTQSVPESWRPIMRGWVGDPEEDRDMLTARSPITYARAVAAPLLVLQGAKDPRVVQAESDQMVEAVRQNGTEVVYEIFPDEGHGFAKHTNVLRGLGMALAFLERHLLGDVAASPDLDEELPDLPS